MAAAMARRLVHNDLLMVGSRIAQRRTRNFSEEGGRLQDGGPWVTLLILFLLFVAIILLLYFIGTMPAGNDYETNKNMVVPGRPVGDATADPFLAKTRYGQQPYSPPPAQNLLPGSGSLGSGGSGSQSHGQQQQPYSAQQQNTFSSQRQSYSSQQQNPYSSQQQQSHPSQQQNPYSSQQQNPYSSQQQQSHPSQQQPSTEQISSPLQTTLNAFGLGGSSLLSPESASRAAWSSAPGVPPPLRPLQIAPQSPKSYRVDVASLRKLYGRAPIPITSEFEHPLFYARLGKGAEGSRLEIADEPSWRNLVATLGRLDYPANLSPDALLHGPGREYYGPFQRYAGGFSVGHWSKGGSQVFTLTPRKNWTGGFFVEVKAGSTDIASVQSIDNGMRYQIDIQPGIDNVLIITSVLAAFIASQPLIDDAGTLV